MSATEPEALATAADREIVISRIVDAPRELLFEAFTEVRHLSRWWGPEGFTTTTRAFEFRVGGEAARGVPRRPERLPVSAHVRGRRRSDPDRDAHRVPHRAHA